MQHQKILILDFGSQVTQLIARRVREAHVYCEVHPCDVSDDWVRQHAADGTLKGVILSGSHASVYEATTDRAPQAVFAVPPDAWLEWLTPVQADALARPSAELTALIAVSAPTPAALLRLGLAPVDFEGEVGRADVGVGGEAKEYSVELWRLTRS